MNNKITRNSILLILLFFLLLTLPQIIAPFCCRGEKSRLAENRNLEPFPNRFVWRKIFSELEAWYNDRLPFRAQLLAMSRRFSGTVFPEIHQRLIHGTDDFYFYTKKGNSEDTYAQYAGLERPRRFEILSVQKFIRKIYQDAKACGCDIVFFIPPNKIDVYPDKLPEKRKAERSLLGWPEKMDTEMRKNLPQIPYYYIRREICEYRNRIPTLIYYATDTHWNFLGGYCGMKILFEKCGWSWPAGWPPPEQAKLQLNGKLEPTDLLNSANYTLLKPKYQEFILKDFSGFPKKVKKIHGEFYFITENPNAPDQREVLIFRDSFCNAMIPYLSAYFRKVHFIWSKYNGAEVRRIKPDFIINECVARYVYTF